MFKTRLKELRLSKGDTQASLAQKMRVSSRTIASYEQGINEPSIDTLKNLSQYFNVSIDYLVGNSNNTEPINIEAVNKDIEQIISILSIYQNDILSGMVNICKFLNHSYSETISQDVITFLDKLIFDLNVILKRYTEYYTVAVHNHENLESEPTKEFMELASRFGINDYKEALFFAQQGFYPRALQEVTHIDKSANELIDKMYQSINSLNTLYDLFSDKYKDGNYTYIKPTEN